MQTPRLSSLSSVASGTRGARLGLLASRLPATPAFLPLRPLRLVSASVLASAVLLERDALLLHLGTACSFSPLRPRLGSAAASSKKPSLHDLCHIVPSSSPCASVTTSQSLAFCIMTAIITTRHRVSLTTSCYLCPATRQSKTSSGGPTLHLLRSLSHSQSLEQRQTPRGSSVHIC